MSKCQKSKFCSQLLKVVILVDFPASSMKYVDVLAASSICVHHQHTIPLVWKDAKAPMYVTSALFGI